MGERYRENSRAMPIKHETTTESSNRLEGTPSESLTTGPFRLLDLPPEPDLEPPPRFQAVMDRVKHTNPILVEKRFQEFMASENATKFKTPVEGKTKLFPLFISMS